MKKLAVFFLAVTLSAPAFAYIDPGTGSTILSAVIGALVAVWIGLKTYGYRIKSFFAKKEQQKSNDHEPS